GKPLGDFSADDSLAYTRLEHPAFDQLELRPQLKACVGNPTNRNVGRFSGTAARKVYEDTKLRRSQRLSLIVVSHTGKGLNQLKRITSHLAIYFRLRSGSYDQQVLRRAGRYEKSVQAVCQRHQRHEHRHHQRDRPHGHQGADLSNNKIAQVVFQWYCHRSLSRAHATRRRPSTILTLAAPHAGIPPLNSPIRADTKRLNTIVAGRILKFCRNGSPEVSRRANEKRNFAPMVPSNPPSRAIKIASESIIEGSTPGRNPRALMTATSVKRSRAVIAIELAAIKLIVKTTTSPTIVIRPLTFPSIETNAAEKAASVSVLVGADELANI